MSDRREKPAEQSQAFLMPYCVLAPDQAAAIAWADQEGIVVGRIWAPLEPADLTGIDEVRPDGCFQIARLAGAHKNPGYDAICELLDYMQPGWR